MYALGWHFPTFLAPTLGIRPSGAETLQRTPWCKVLYAAKYSPAKSPLRRKGAEYLLVRMMHQWFTVCNSGGWCVLCIVGAG